MDKKKFSYDALVGLISVAILGFSGLLLNILIVKFYGVISLGVFNQVYAIYILGSQFGSLGLQYSVLKFSAQFSHEYETLQLVFISGFIIIILSSTVISVSICLARDLIASVLNSSEIAPGILWATPGLLFFSINKYLLNTLNGIQKNKQYSYLVSLRYLALLFGLTLLCIFEFPGDMLPAIFSIAELMLFILLAFNLRQLFNLHIKWWSSGWPKRHLMFGISAFPGGVFAEANTRIDVLMIGFYLNDKWVGLFSFASMLVEGLIQIPLVIKRQMDPIITNYVTSNNYIKLESILKLVIYKVSIVMTVIAIIAIISYPFFTNYVLSEDELNHSWKVFSILIGFAALQGGYITVSGMLSQSGHPIAHSSYLLLVSITNIIFNLILIPRFGISGAAIATGVSFFASVIYLKLMVRKLIGIKI